VNRRARALGAAAIAVFAASQVSHAAAPSAPAHHPGHLSSWISESVKVMKANGTPAAALDRGDIALIIQHESGGNPWAVNLTDVNAAAGHPSRGLTQTTPATFRAYCLPGYCSDITDPVSNIVAGVRYALARYGSLGNVPGVAAVHDGLPYIGY
jgi:SLT domain-containing protein